jgi:hypothetical protein
MTEPDVGLVLHDGQQLPTTKSLRTVLREGLDALQAEEYAARGGAEVEKPEDAYALIRRYAAVEETAVDYGRAFLDFAKDVRERSGEQLSLMYGEQDGVPNADAAVPDTDGTTIKVKRQHENRYQFNVDTIISAAVVDMLSDGEVNDALEEMFQSEFKGDGENAIRSLTWVLAEAVKRVLATGKFEAQVTKVKALAKQAASRGDDQLASTVTGAINKKTRLKGITLEREQPKEK